MSWWNSLRSYSADWIAAEALIMMAMTMFQISRIELEFWRSRPKRIIKSIKPQPLPIPQVLDFRTESLLKIAELGNEDFQSCASFILVDQFIQCPEAVEKLKSDFQSNSIDIRIKAQQVLNFIVDRSHIRHPEFCDDAMMRAIIDGLCRTLFNPCSKEEENYRSRLLEFIHRIMNPTFIGLSTQCSSQLFEFFQMYHTIQKGGRADLLPLYDLSSPWRHGFNPVYRKIMLRLSNQHSNVIIFDSKVFTEAWPEYLEKYVDP